MAAGIGRCFRPDFRDPTSCFRGSGCGWKYDSRLRRLARSSYTPARSQCSHLGRVLKIDSTVGMKLSGAHGTQAELPPHGSAPASQGSTSISHSSHSSSWLASMGHRGTGSSEQTSTLTVDNSKCGWLSDMFSSKLLAARVLGGRPPGRSPAGGLGGPPSLWVLAVH